MPRTLKQYYRLVLSKFGLFNEMAFQLAIDEIRPDDIFLVSYPKSGNTWLRFLLANLFFPSKEIHFRNIDTFVPDVYVAPGEVNTAQSPRLIKVHHLVSENFPKIIYIVRDYRDVLVSYFHYQVSLGDFSGSFSEFIHRVDMLHPFGSWKEHVSKAFAFSEKHPDRILILRYEDLLQETTKELGRISDFIGFKGTISFEMIVEKCRFEQLKMMEQKHGSMFNEKSGKLFFREGKSGGWQNVFSKEDLRIVLQEQGNMPVLLKAGYSID